jgi:hypothetical protein
MLRRRRPRERRFDEAAPQLSSAVAQHPFESRIDVTGTAALERRLCRDPPDGIAVSPNGPELSDQPTHRRHLVL